ncbi:IPP transferase-domain-containing protein [Biscogniauxia mediterranea]|nr:IPP transferase-domain-containing protein [Biscogniauxia mediterranea]
MTALNPPKEPLVAIIGSTGTGKSDLAIDLAIKFNGEIINADAMQMYKGLPVITNQISPEEQRGIPHHLLASIDPREPTWTVGLFAREARKLIKEIRSRGKLPIVVGGTHYYIHSLLFEGSLVRGSGIETDDMNYRPEGENNSQFPILNEPTNIILGRLREVDPVMAERWHPDDRRKIKRSLEIYLTTGKRASDIYAEQKQSKLDSDSVRRPWEALLFWIYTDPEVLKERLDKRVDKMVQRGLMDEVKSLHSSLHQRTSEGEVVDRSQGIWQSIGHKQMEPFIESEIRGDPIKERERLKEIGLEDMRAATRQYARYQLRWIRHKSMTALKDHNAMDYLYLLDSTDAREFSTRVLQPAADICQQFLDGDELIKPTDVSDVAREVLTSFEKVNASAPSTYKVKTCEVCNMSLATEDQWNQHIGGRKHRRLLRERKKIALVKVDPECQSYGLSGVRPDYRE